MSRQALQTSATALLLMTMTLLGTAPANAGPLNASCSLSDIDWAQPYKDALMDIEWSKTSCREDDLALISLGLSRHAGCAVNMDMINICNTTIPTPDCWTQNAILEINYQRTGNVGEIHIYGYNPVTQDEMLALLAWDGGAQNAIAMEGCDRHSSGSPLRQVDVQSIHRSGSSLPTAPVTRTVTLPHCSGSAVDPDWTGLPARTSFGYNWGDGACVSGTASQFVEYGLTIVGAPQTLLSVPTELHIQGDLYIDRYQTGSLIYPCVTGELRVDGSTQPIDPCVGTFSSRFLTLLYQDGAQLPAGTPVSIVEICDAELTALVLGFGVTAMGGFKTLC